MPVKSGGRARPPKARTSGQSASAADRKSLHRETDKTADLARGTVDPGEIMAGNQGIKISDDQNSLKAIGTFTYAKRLRTLTTSAYCGAAAHGVFRVYEDLSDLTIAGLLTDPSRDTPVFVRFSTVAGSRGSTDCARDVRGFAVKFYSAEGVWNLVGNNMPVFFIQDAIKFPDLIHPVKPEPNNEIPQAASAHDKFWDFVSLTPESAHMLMWVMSDRPCRAASQ